MAVDYSQHCIWFVNYFITYYLYSTGIDPGRWSLILAAECMNTAIERVVDDISMDRRPAAKHAKDAGSAAVAITAIATGVLGL